MKRVLIRSLTCFFVLLSLLFCIPSFTSAATTMITVVFSNIQLYLDGHLLTPTDSYGTSVQPLIYNDTTYLPVRSIANMFGNAVEWDQVNNAIYFTSNSQIDSNTTMRRVNWHIGGGQINYIDMDENIEEKWELIGIEKPLIEFLNDEYIDNGSNSKRLHRFSFRAKRDVPVPENINDAISIITFEQKKGLQKTGKKIVFEIYISPSPNDEKPVIYLYPNEQTNVSVLLDYNGDITCTYPKYNDGWHVTAYPGGRLVNDDDGLEYSYLFWEGRSNAAYDIRKGFVVKGEDTALFLQDKLSSVGLLPKEYNDFIVYWLPKIQNNPYNLISFQDEAYTDNAKLDIAPKPDSILRVFVVFKALEQPISISPQTLKPFIRQGFSVVEWGGQILE